MDKLVMFTRLYDGNHGNHSKIYVSSDNVSTVSSTSTHSGAVVTNIVLKGGQSLLVCESLDTVIARLSE